MTVLQIIMLCILGVGSLVALGFTIAFIVETLKKDKPEVEAVRGDEKDEEVTEIDLEAMLARLEEASNSKEEAPTKEPEVEVKEEKAEEPVIEVAVEQEAPVEEMPTTESVVEEIQEEVVEGNVEAKEEEAPIILVNQVEEKAVPEFDYRVRLEKIKDSQERIDKDLEKTTRAIMKYERTIRRKDRNQKMLDRRALELTNLNLLMYSVTDIKNVDAEKKARQEELTAHISELKASIHDAENYINANKEKHENNLKLRDYLAHEKKRYADEVKELEGLIASGKYFDESADGSNGEADN